MKPSDYTNPEKYPMTSQKGLSVKDQMFLDSFRYDQTKQFLEEGNKLSPEGEKRWAELQEKVKYHPELLKKLVKED